MRDTSRCFSNTLCRIADAERRSHGCWQLPGISGDPAYDAVPCHVMAGDHTCRRHHACKALRQVVQSSWESNGPLTAHRTSRRRCDSEICSGTDWPGVSKSATLKAARPRTASMICAWLVNPDSVCGNKPDHVYIDNSGGLSESSLAGPAVLKQRRRYMAQRQSGSEAQGVNESRDLMCAATGGAHSPQSGC